MGVLVKTDMGVQAAEAIVEEVGTKYRARVMQMDEVVASIKVKLKELLAHSDEPIRFALSGPTVIMVAGVNGAGKTTSIAKLAHLFMAQGKSVVLGAGDTFRAAAVEQLTIWAGRLGAEIVKGEQGSDPASVAHRAVALAIEAKADVCIIDTAGRLQTQQNLMQQLTKIHRVIGKQIPDGPARSAAGAGRHDGPERHQPGQALYRRGKLHRHRAGKARRHGQRRRGGGHSPAGRAAGQIRGRRRAARGSDAVCARRLCRGPIPRPARGARRAARPPPPAAPAWFHPPSFFFSPPWVPRPRKLVTTLPLRARFRYSRHAFPTRATIPPLPQDYAIFRVNPLQAARRYECADRRSRPCAVAAGYESGSAEPTRACPNTLAPLQRIGERI